MARFFGPIGFVQTVETEPGIWEEQVSEINYVGDVIRNTKRYEPGMSINDNLALNNLISVVADSFAISNLGNMRYVGWSGTNWKITNVEIQRPRLILTIGGVYNGES